MPQMGGGNGSGFDYIQSATPENPQNGESWFDLDGGSDGTGEVKVYDGASGAWEVTGYTSHGDLTDVTPDAHHSPVSVSGPLTEDGEQGLGLSVGDGLDVSGETLLAALSNPLTVDVDGNVAVSLGNGLTLDVNGQVSIPASAVGTSELADGAVSEAKLAFDTATQAELDSLASATSSDISALDTALTDHETSTSGVHGIAASDTVAGRDEVDSVASDLTDHADRIDNPHSVTNEQTGAADALSAHASDDDAHHAQPTSTATASQPGNYLAGVGLGGSAKLRDGDTSTSVQIADGATETVRYDDAVLDGCKLHTTIVSLDGSRTLEVEVLSPNLSTVQSATIDSSGVHEITFSPESVDQIELTASGGQVSVGQLIPRVVGLAPHSHDI